MPTNVTLAALRTKCQRRGELRDLHSTAELNEAINDSIAHLYDLLIGWDPSRYLTTASQAITSGTADYTLSTLAGDLYQVVAVDVLDATVPSGRVPVERYNYRERHLVQTQPADKYSARYEIRGGKLRLYPTPQWSGTIEIGYIPTAPLLAADGDTWDSVNRWDEWVVLDVVRKAQIKRRESVSELLVMQQALLERIRSVASPDRARPRTVVSVDDIGDGRRRRSARYW